jgi:hypothetical protein
MTLMAQHGLFPKWEQGLNVERSVRSVLNLRDLIAQLLAQPFIPSAPVTPIMPPHALYNDHNRHIRYALQNREKALQPTGTLLCGFATALVPTDASSWSSTASANRRRI